MKIEFFNAIPMEIRSESKDQTAPKLVGYAVKWNSFSEPFVGYDDDIRETIKPYSFTESLKGKENIKALWNHNRDFVLGSTRNNSLILLEDDIGLKFEIVPPNTQWASDCIISIQRGDIDTMSFGFVLNDDSVEWKRQKIDDREILVRELSHLKLIEISPVSWAAYADTNVVARDLKGLYDDYIKKQTGNFYKDTKKLLDIQKTLDLRGVN